MLLLSRTTQIEQIFYLALKIRFQIAMENFHLYVYYGPSNLDHDAKFLIFRLNKE